MKSEFSFNLVSTETIKRIISDLGIKKLLQVKFQHYLFKKRDVILDTVPVL